MRKPAISVIGSGQCDAYTFERAELLGKLLAESGFNVVCGGLGGVMEGVCKGVSRAGGTAIGILPGLDLAAANPFVDIPVATGLGPMRNFLVVSNGLAVVAVEGGYGTLSEIGLARKTGKTVIAMGCYQDLDGVVPAADPHEAVRLVLNAVNSRESE